MRQRSRHRHLSSRSQTQLSPFLDSILFHELLYTIYIQNLQAVTSIAGNPRRRLGIGYDWPGSNGVHIAAYALKAKSLVQHAFQLRPEHHVALPFEFAYNLWDVT